MKKISISFIAILFFAACVLFFLKVYKIKPIENGFLKAHLPIITALSNIETQTPPFKAGERFDFLYNLGPLNIGTAKLTFVGATTYSAQDAYLITFESKVGNFYDLESIYAEPTNFYPVYIERKIRNFGIPSHIKEVYNQTDYKIEISKRELFGQKKEVIKKKSRIQNALLLMYYCRKLLAAGLNQGDEFNVVLPVDELKVILKGKERIKVPAGTFEAYLFESVPEKIKLWISVDERHMPLKMENLSSIGPSSIILKEAS